MVIRAIGLSLCLALATPAPLAAATVTEQIVEQLQDQGFTRIRITRTLLGRARIVATSREYRREIVVNPATGEILRDYVRRLRGAGGDDPKAPDLVDPHGSGAGGGSGSAGDDDEGGGSRPGDDDDDDEDDGDEDGGDDDDDDDDANDEGGGGGDDDDDDDDDDD